MSETKDNAKIATKNLIASLNRLGFEDEGVKGIVEALKGEHRTLQQSFWRAIIAAAGEYQNFNHDLRNEASVKACGKITEAVGEVHIPFV